MQKTFADDYAQIMNSYGKRTVNKVDKVDLRRAVIGRFGREQMPA
jgi:hypothetical protein